MDLVAAKPSWHKPTPVKLRKQSPSTVTTRPTNQAVCRKAQFVATAVAAPTHDHSLSTDPGIRENAKRTIERIRAKQKKKQADFTKRKNLATTNFSNFDKEGQDRILSQALTLRLQASESASIASSITGVTGGTLKASPSKSAGSKRVVFLNDALALNTDIHRPVLSVSIQLIMPHINLQLGTDLNDASSPSIRCVVDTAAALCIGNYHFFAAIAKQYPQCVAKIYLPNDYSPIILSGIVQDDADAITTDLPVPFQFHLPYFTKDGSATSFVVATGPQVSVNTVLGLPLITASGMVIDFVDEVVEAKNLDCPPFKINFRRAAKTVPATESKAPTTYYIEFEDVQCILWKTDAYIARVCNRLTSGPHRKAHPAPSVQFHPGIGCKSNQHPSVSNTDTVATPTQPTDRPFGTRWVPPPSAHDTRTEYQDQFLGEDGYL